MWLEGYLKTYKKCLVMVSHSQDFLNGVCTHIILLSNRKLTYYTGNYDTFCKTVAENEVIQSKKHAKEQEGACLVVAGMTGRPLSSLKQTSSTSRSSLPPAARTRTWCAKPSRSKKSWTRCMKPASRRLWCGSLSAARRSASRLQPRPAQRKERTFNFDFPDCDKLPPPVLPFVGVSFSYSGKKEEYLYEDLNLGIDCDSRVALVGPNGAGKSTLLKLMVGDLTPSEGVITRHPHLSIGRYYQHSADLLDMNATVLEFFKNTYPNTTTFVRDEEQWRSFLGRYGISGKLQSTKIEQMSDGQKSRIVIATICMANPNLLLLDEPTNHLCAVRCRRAFTSP